MDQTACGKTQREPELQRRVHDLEGLANEASRIFAVANGKADKIMGPITLNGQTPDCPPPLPDNLNDRILFATDSIRASLAGLEVALGRIDC